MNNYIKLKNVFNQKILQFFYLQDKMNLSYLIYM
jgi:hypothetical protein